MAQSAVIGALRVVLGLDSATFDAGLDKARAKATEHAGGIGKALDSIFDSSRLRLFEEGGAKLNVFGSALEHLGAVGIGVGVTLGALAIGFEEVKKSLEFADKLADAAKAASVSTTALQEYRFAVHDLGGQYQDADKAITDFTVKFRLAAAEYSKKSTKPFEALGLDAKTLGDTESGLKATIAAIHNLKDAGDQAAAAEKTGLTPMLAAIRAGGPEIDRLRQAAHDLGYVMDEDLIAKGGEANKKFQDLSAVIGVQFRSAFVELAPEILSITEKVADLATWFGKLFNMGGMSGTTQEELHALATLVKDIGHPIQGFMDASNISKVQVDAVRNGGFIKNLYGPVAPVPAEAAPAGTGTFHVNAAPKNGNAVRNASASAIDAAMKEELAAETALVGNIAKLAVMRRAEVDQEITAKNAKLAREASEGKITKAAADQAILLNTRTAEEKKALITREATFAAQNAELAQREAINGFAQQAAQIEEGLAATTAARNVLQTKGLADQQKIDRDRKAAETDQAVIAGKMTPLAALELLDAQSRLQDDQRLQLAEQQRIAAVEESARHEQAGLQLQAELLTAQAGVLKSSFARNVAAQKILEIDQQIERSKAQEAVDVAKVGSVERQEAQARLAALPAIQKAQSDVLASQTRLVDAIGEASASAADLASAFKSHNWARVFDDFQATIQTVEAAFASQGRSGGIITAGSAVGSAVGGKTGNAIAEGFGIAALGEFAGSALFSSTVSAAFSGAIGGGLANLGLGLSAILGPIGIIAGIGVALYGILGGSKPSNNAAISTLTGDSFSLSGDKRNADTTGRATSASNAILQGEALLKAAGVKLGATVSSIDIGTRDATHILLSNGQAMSSAVGDAAAAAEAGLKGVLQNATFTSDAEKQLVDAMLAAGKGFDAISTALQNFDAAQLLTGSVASAIQKLSDPQGYDIAQLKAAQAARAAQAQAAADAGYLTADQLSAINDQLARLDKIELDQVVKKYADALTAAAQAASDSAAKAAAGVTSTARQALSAAVQAQVTALSQTAQQFGAIATSLSAYAATLNGAGAAGGASYSSLSASFSRTAASAQLGDLTAAGALQGIGDSFLASSLANAHSQADYLKDLAKVKAGVTAAAATATRQASIAQQQLDALHAQTDGLLQINSSVLSVADAIAGLQDALAAEAAAGPTAYAAALAAAQAGPAITDTSQLPASASGNVSGQLVSGETNDLLRQMLAKQDQAMMESQAGLIAVAKNTGSIDRRIQRVTPDGNSLLTSAA